jgi:hypothetical protein
MLFHPRAWKLGTLAVLLLAAAPASSSAGWLGFRNDIKDTIVVQSSPATNRGVVPALGRPKAMVAGEVAWESLLVPGNRQIRIYDSNKVLIYTKTIPVVGDLFFSIQLDPKTNAVQLVPIKAPVKPPGQK